MVPVIKGEPAVDMRLDEGDGDQHDHGRDGTEEGTKDQKAFAVGHGENSHLAIAIPQSHRWGAD
jgi:hypothetical protein